MARNRCSSSRPRSWRAVGVETLLDRYPLAGMFLWPQTRPSPLFSAGLVFTAIVWSVSPYANKPAGR